MNRYEVIIYWSAEDESFVALVPELPGCMADGASHQEALANVEVVIREWIETARELGRPIPEPRGGWLTRSFKSRTNARTSRRRSILAESKSLRPCSKLRFSLCRNPELDSVR